MDIKDRLAALIAYKCDGRTSDFAARLGWSKQYLNKLLNGNGGIGLTPVTTLLAAFPDLSARWLILGEGPMTDRGGYMLSRLSRLFALEKYIPVMDSRELHDYCDSWRVDWDQATIDKWQSLLDGRTGPAAHDPVQQPKPPRRHAEPRE